MASNERKLWSDESMIAATSSVLQDNLGVRESARLYNVPYETLRRRVNGSVKPGCKPGPGTILTEEEEDQLARYLLDMAEMGFGLNRETVMCLAYKIVEKSLVNIHLKMKRQVGHGSMDSEDDIPSSLFALLSRFLTLEHYVPTKILSMIFLENWVLYLVD